VILHIEVVTDMPRVFGHLNTDQWQLVRKDGPLLEIYLARDHDNQMHWLRFRPIVAAPIVKSDTYRRKLVYHGACWGLWLVKEAIPDRSGPLKSPIQ
jgi:hypothetical protein